MAVRHYNLEYNVDGNAWQLGRADETPGPGKEIQIAGLATGTHAVKLRLVPLDGSAPVESQEVILQVGVPALAEPVATQAQAVVTLADVAVRRDALLAAAGVEVSAADAQAMNEALMASSAGAVSVVDVQQTSNQETVTALTSAAATITDVQTMLEQVVAAISAQATAADVFSAGAGAGPIASDDFSGTLSAWGAPIYTGAGAFTGSSDVIDTANSRVIMTFVRNSSSGAATMRVPWTTSYTVVAGRAFVVEGHALRITFANGAYLTIEKHPVPVWVGEEPEDYETRLLFVDGYTSGGVNGVTQAYEYAVANDSNVLKVAFVDATHIDVFVGGVKVVSNRDISGALPSGNITPERHIYWENATGTRTEYVYGFEVY